MIAAAALVFWLCLAVCIYIYFGYPGLLFVLSRLRPRPVAEADITPKLTLIVPAYNEEANIAAKIESSLASDYPREQIEIVVASNGSTDRTNDIVRAWPDDRVRLVAMPQPGKIAGDAERLVDHQPFIAQLREHADRADASQRSACGFDLACDQAKQCGFAGAVAADKAGAFAPDRERQSIEKRASVRRGEGDGIQNEKGRHGGLPKMD